MQTHFLLIATSPISSRVISKYLLADCIGNWLNKSCIHTIESYENIKSDAVTNTLIYKMFSYNV